MPWTAPKTWSAGEVVTAANMNIHLRDNMLAGGPHLIARKTADETVASSTTLQPDNDLILPVGANEVWQCRFCLRWTASATGDIQINFTFPASGEIELSAAAKNTTAVDEAFDWRATTSPSETKNIGIANTSVVEFLVIEGLCITAGTAGNLTLQWAQAASDATATIVKANSTLWGVKLA
jgi:hypothetical protein